MRFSPVSYFCTAWKERPSLLPSSICVMPTCARRSRRCPPTWQSIGSGPSTVTVRRLNENTSPSGIASIESAVGLLKPFLPSCSTRLLKTSASIQKLQLFIVQMQLDKLPALRAAQIIRRADNISLIDDREKLFHSAAHAPVHPRRRAGQSAIAKR